MAPGRTGCDRLRSAAQTIEWVTPFLPEMGITRIADVTGMDRLGIPVAQVIRPNSRSITVSQGKGPDLTSAKASAVMESIEGFHAENCALPLTPRGYQEMIRADDGLAADRLILASETRPPSDQKRIDCVIGLDLVERVPQSVPFDIVHTDYTLPPESLTFHCSSNGLATGNTMDEATLSALTELLERDALADWSRLGAYRHFQRSIDPVSVTQPLARAWIEKIEDENLCLDIWDVSNDLEIPVILCRIAEAPGNGQAVRRPCYGAGCYPDANIALARALAEAAQARIVKISGVRDDMMPEDFGPLNVGEKMSILSDRRDRAGRTLHPFDALCRDAPSAPVELVGFLLQRLVERTDCQIVRVDLTKPEFGIPVVRVIAAGLGAPIGHHSYVLGKRSRYATPEMEMIA